MKKNKTSKKVEPTKVPLNEQKPALVLSIFQRQILLYAKQHYSQTDHIKDLCKIYSVITELPEEYYQERFSLILKEVMKLTEDLNRLDNYSTFSEVILKGFKNGQGTTKDMIAALLSSLFHVQTNNGEKLFLQLGKAEERFLPLNPY